MRCFYTKVSTNFLKAVDNLVEIIIFVHLQGCLLIRSIIVFYKILWIILIDQKS